MSTAGKSVSTKPAEPTETTHRHATATAVAQEVVFDEDGDLIFLFPDDRVTRGIKVSFKVIGLMTNFFEHMKTLSLRHPCVATFHVSEFDSVLLLCNICYHKGSQIPINLDIDALGMLAATIMDLDCREALLPFFHIWSEQIQRQRPDIHVLLNLLAIDYILDDAENFRRRSRQLIITTHEAFPGQPFPVGPLSCPASCQAFHNRLPHEVLWFLSSCRQSLKARIQAEIESAISSMVSCECSQPVAFHLRDLKTKGLWPLATRPWTIYALFDLLSLDYIREYDPEPGSQCDGCKDFNFPAKCKELVGQVNLNDVGLDLARFKEATGPGSPDSEMALAGDGQNAWGQGSMYEGGVEGSRVKHRA